MQRVAKKRMSDKAAERFLARIEEEISGLKDALADLEVSQPEQTEVLDEFQGINLASYSLEEKRELPAIVVKEIRLRFDRMFITYNLYEAPGKLYVDRVDIDRHPAHNSKLRRKQTDHAGVGASSTDACVDGRLALPISGSPCFLGRNTCLTKTRDAGYWWSSAAVDASELLVF